MGAEKFAFPIEAFNVTGRYLRFRHLATGLSHQDLSRAYDHWSDVDVLQLYTG